MKQLLTYFKVEGIDNVNSLDDLELEQKLLNCAVSGKRFIFIKSPKDGSLNEEETVILKSQKANCILKN